ncbi:hypothetical protein DFH08DRAFT_971344 [Mycena albidolilacea]|uniref:Uncharacterized protein n=1 Tax=Mycena albidolilacea TaxID=1033008 RepID=A0AAD6ZE89_9AGAR|nr:hypothetical protein DFH08DRAFT_971344 [Mycena albidolilacea]
MTKDQHRHLFFFCSLTIISTAAASQLFGSSCNVLAYNLNGALAELSLLATHRAARRRESGMCMRASGASLPRVPHRRVGALLCARGAVLAPLLDTVADCAYTLLPVADCLALRRTNARALPLPSQSRRATHPLPFMQHLALAIRRLQLSPEAREPDPRSSADSCTGPFLSSPSPLFRSSYARAGCSPGASPLPATFPHPLSGRRLPLLAPVAIPLPIAPSPTPPSLPFPLHSRP